VNSFSLFFSVPTLLLLGILSALVSAIETALFSLRSADLRTLRQTAPLSAKHIERLFEDPRRSTNTFLLGDSLINALLIFFCLLTVQPLAAVGELPGWLVALGVFSAVIIFCEVLPKVIAIHGVVPVLALLSGFAGCLVRVLGPAVERLQVIGDQIRLLVPGMEQPKQSPAEARQDYLNLVDLASLEGSLGRTESNIIGEVVKLGLENVTHCMTPRVDTFSLPDNLTGTELQARLRTRRYSRVPIYGNTPDDVVGILKVNRFFLDPETPYTEQLTPPSFIPDTMNALQLLQSFLLRNQRIAILLDEYGGIEGIVTLSDLMEEVVGEEGAGSNSNLYLEMLAPDRCLASGNARLDDLAELLGCELPQTLADTLGGMVSGIHGSIPRPGTIFSIPGWRATVRRASRKRIKEVLFERVPETKDQDREGHQ